MAGMREPKRSAVLRRARAIAKAGPASRMSRADFCRACGIRYGIGVRDLLQDELLEDGRTLYEAAISDTADNIWTMPADANKRRALMNHRKAKA